MDNLYVLPVEEKEKQEAEHTLVQQKNKEFWKTGENFLQWEINFILLSEKKKIISG